MEVKCPKHTEFTLIASCKSCLMTYCSSCLEDEFSRCHPFQHIHKFVDYKEFEKIKDNLSSNYERMKSIFNHISNCRLSV